MTVIFKSIPNQNKLGFKQKKIDVSVKFLKKLVDENFKLPEKYFTKRL